MAKKILLKGGPEDGKAKTVDDDLKVYTTLRPIAPGKIVLLGFEKGYYRATGEQDNGRQVFEWSGWEGDRN